MTSLAEKIGLLHDALDRATLPHAFGGALALAWCTERARGTIDIDLNVFVGVDSTADLLAALPTNVTWTRGDADLLRRDGQVRLWWDTTPVDLFLNTTAFHESAAGRARSEPFGERMVPFLGCDDLAVFKAFFNRTKDWADLEEMAKAGTLDLASVIGAIVLHLGGDDERVAKLRALG